MPPPRPKPAASRRPAWVVWAGVGVLLVAGYAGVRAARRTASGTTAGGASPAPTPFPYQVGTARGRFTVDGKDLALDHAYVFADPEKRCPQQRRIVLSEGPLPDTIRRLRFYCRQDKTEEVARLAQASGVHAVLVTVEVRPDLGPHGQGVTAFHETFFHGRDGVGGGVVFQPTDYADTRTAGRVLSADSRADGLRPREHTSWHDGVTTRWSFDAEFEATGDLPAAPSAEASAPPSAAPPAPAGPAAGGIRVPEVEALIGDLTAGRHADAYERFSTDYRGRISLDRFRAYVDGCPPLRGNGGLSCAEPRRDGAGTVQQVRCELRAPSGRLWQASLAFAPGGGALKVASLSLSLREPDHLHGSNGLRITTGGVQLSGSTGSLRLDFTSDTYGKRRIDAATFAYDLETVAELLGPDEQPIPHFSLRQRASRTGRYDDPDYAGEASFRWVPGELPPGAYVVRLAVTDHVLPDTATGELYGFALY